MNDQEQVALYETKEQEGRESGIFGGAGGRHCVNCGALLEEGLLFCTECGTPIGSGVQASPINASPVNDIEIVKNGLGTKGGTGTKPPTKKWIPIIAAIILAIVAAVVVIIIVNPKSKRQGSNAPAPAPVQNDVFENDTEPQTQMEHQTQMEPQISPVSMSSLQNVSATSFLVEDKYRYIPEYLIDSDRTTSWCEGVNGSGIGEGVSFAFTSKQSFKGIAFRNGYQKKMGLYKMNSRVKTLKVVDGEGNVQFVFLQDKPGLQVIDFDEPIVSAGISLYIEEVYNGELYEDTNITEVVFYGSENDKSLLETTANTEVIETPARDNTQFPRTMFVDGMELRVRTGPGLGYTPLVLVNIGDELYVYGIEGNGWARISWYGQTAYVYSGYLEDQKP